ncbi:hypothetical protein E8P82_04690 [Arthrobacter echini]|uniref:Uncharacterized protein n=1 Tax=Arthrobacter echini TaxID=1529066 RepID=A0A4S5E743_9MICC|nr:hypothetical protein [Arthrobacter echini]THJ67407.1 hypothetical protein E8P82_04690 [Arthrobacter echini]
MVRKLSSALTAVTVVTLLALVLIMIVDPLTGTDLGPLVGPIAWILGALVVVRLVLGIRHARSAAAAPVMDSGAVQSQLFGFRPGSSGIEHPDGSDPTTSVTDERRRLGPGEEPR